MPRSHHRAESIRHTSAVSGTGPAFDRPIIILGAPRSGTTFLGYVLGSATSCTLVNEPRLVWRYGNDGRSDQLRATDATPRVAAHIRSSLAAMVHDAGAERLVEKTPANSLRPGFVASVFPEARFVHITRNGWAAVPSLRAMWERRGTSLDQRKRARTVARLREAQLSQWPHYAGEFVSRLSGRITGRVPLVGARTPGLSGVLTELGVLTAAAIQWRECTTQSTAFGRSLGSDRYLELKLESLSETTFNEVLEFCDVDDVAPLLELFHRLHDGRVAVRGPDLSADEIDLLAPYVEPTNSWLGYPTTYQEFREAR